MAWKGIKKAELAFMERLWAAEIAGTLPVQSKAWKIIDALRGSVPGLSLIEAVSRKLPGHPPVTVSGWALTERGRHLFCQWCSEHACG